MAQGEQPNYGSAMSDRRRDEPANEVIYLRMTEKQKVAMAKAAKKQGLLLTQWARRELLAAAAKEFPS